MRWILAAVAATLGLAQPAKAVIFDFEDLEVGPVTDTSYGDFILTGAAGVASFDVTGFGKALLLEYGTPIVITRADGGYFLMPQFSVMNWQAGYSGIDVKLYGMIEGVAGQEHHGMGIPTITNEWVADSGMPIYPLGDIYVLNRVEVFIASHERIRSVAIDNLELIAVNSAIPEPATWAMMIVGFGMVGGMLRHRAGSRLSAA